MKKEIKGEMEILLTELGILNDKNLTSTDTGELIWKNTLFITPSEKGFDCLIFLFQRAITTLQHFRLSGWNVPMNVVIPWGEDTVYYFKALDFRYLINGGEHIGLTGLNGYSSAAWDYLTGNKLKTLNHNELIPILAMNHRYFKVEVGEDCWREWETRFIHEGGEGRFSLELKQPTILKDYIIPCQSIPNGLLQKEALADIPGELDKVWKNNNDVALSLQNPFDRLMWDNFGIKPIGTKKREEDPNPTMKDRLAEAIRHAPEIIERTCSKSRDCSEKEASMEKSYRICEEQAKKNTPEDIRFVAENIVKSKAEPTFEEIIRTELKTGTAAKLFENFTASEIGTLRKEFDKLYEEKYLDELTAKASQTMARYERVYGSEGESLPEGTTKNGREGTRMRTILDGADYIASTKLRREHEEEELEESMRRKGMELR